MIRPEITELVKLGPFPTSKDAQPATIEQHQDWLHRVKPPVTDAEARELVKLFGSDDYFVILGWLGQFCI
jgi:hypothetical protein